MFTTWDWIISIGFMTCALGFSIYLILCRCYAGAIINFALCLCVTVSLMYLVGWYHTSTASGMREMKDFKSEIENGIEREITITSEDGRQIFYYDGKVDVESNHTDNYIKFDDENGKRYIIYYGIQDTITIIEK